MTRPDFQPKRKPDGVHMKLNNSYEVGGIRWRLSLLSIQLRPNL